MKEEAKEEIVALTSSNKIPPFWKPDPELWFCQMEAVFSRCRITNSLTKFQTVIPQFEFDVLQQVADIVKHPSNAPYEDLKTRLISTYAESEHKRIQQLLEGKQLGDEKPSQLLRQMTQLAGDTEVNWKKIFLAEHKRRRFELGKMLHRLSKIENYTAYHYKTGRICSNRAF